MSHDSSSTFSKTILGFWLYLLTDLVFFGVLIAVYVVLQKGTAKGATPSEIFHLPFVLQESLVLLTSSLTLSLGVSRLGKASFWPYIALTLLLGGWFFTLQGIEIKTLLLAGHHWTQSAFLSSYFTLLFVHALHMALALLFLLFFSLQLFLRGVDGAMLTRWSCLRMFWAFLYVLWIVLYSYVYLLGGS